MSDETQSDESIRLNEHEREAIADKVPRKPWKMYQHVSPEAGSPASGIRVLSLSEAAEAVGKSKRHLARLEHVGDMPRRRRISRRRTGYFLHELQGLSADAVVVRDPRTLGREELAEKLGMNEKTVTRMVQEGEMPPPDHGRWFERDIDAWLLERPQV